MIAVPKLLLFILLGVAAWYAMRWLNRADPPKAVRRRQAAAGPAPAVEDLTACKICGAYVAASARACDRPGCPLLR
jgi:hypothetical protein